MRKADLDKLTAKQDFLRPKKLTKDQERKMQLATEEERRAFQDVSPVTLKTLKSLTPVNSTDLLYVARTVEHAYVSKKMKGMIEELEKRVALMLKDGIIIVVSMTRTKEETLMVNPTISIDDTHMKGEAIDIAGKFMRINFPESSKVVFEIIKDMKREKLIYFSNEEDINAFWHIARVP